MTPLALALLRRVTAYALVVALLLVSVPPALRFVGVLGPSLQEEISGVERSLLAAESYGAHAGEPLFAGARLALARARELAASGERWQAKRAIAEARRGAIEAQRLALVTRDEQRRAAQKIVTDLDRLLNELEDLYSAAVKGLDEKQESRLFSLMKATRQRSAALFLAFEEQSYEKVVAGESEVRAQLAATRQELLAARGEPRASPARRP